MEVEETDFSHYEAALLLLIVKIQKVILRDLNRIYSLNVTFQNILQRLIVPMF